MSPSPPSSAESVAVAAPVSRRRFLARTGAAAGLGAAATMAGPRLAFATPDQPDEGDAIVFVFLRGGADGLSLVAPHRMPSYRALRPTLRVRSPEEFTNPTGVAGIPIRAGGQVAPFDLDDVFAFHPALRPLAEGPWAEGRLAIVNAVGLPASVSDTRSHFDAQRWWDTGANSASVSSGVLNRYLGAMGATTRLAGMGHGNALQRSLAGPVPAYAVSELSEFTVSGFADNPRAESVLRDWYRSTGGDRLVDMGAATLRIATEAGAVNWTSPTVATRPGVQYDQWNELSRGLRQVARAIRAGLGLRVASVDLEHWDTHADQGRPEDPNSLLHSQTRRLAQALMAFWTDLGPMRDEVTVVVVSEFGRTIAENGSGGTDHGRGGTMFVLGGRVRGGVYGAFPATIEDGPEGDLPVLTDWRTVLAEVLTVRGGLPSSALPTVLPGWSGMPLGLCLG